MPNINRQLRFESVSNNLYANQKGFKIDFLLNGTLYRFESIVTFLSIKL